MNARNSRTRNRIKPAQMAELLRKYGACVECGSTENLTGDHIISIHQGGQNVIENLTLLCRSCNSRKGRLVDRGGH